MKIKHQKVMKLVLILAIIASFVFIFSGTTYATSWTEPSVSATTKIGQAETYQDSPVATTIRVRDKPLSYAASVTKGRHIWLAQYTDPQTYRTSWAVKSPYDQYFTDLVGVPNDLISLVPGTDTLIWEDYTGNYGYGGLVTTRDAWKALKLQFADGRSFYGLESTKAKQWFVTRDYNNSPTQLRVLSKAVSPNGRYILAWLNYSYYLKIDLDANTIQYIGRFPGAWYGGPSINPYAGAITADGRYAFIYGGPQVVDTDGCGEVLSETQIVSGFVISGQNECPVSNLSEVVHEKTQYSGYDSNYHWNFDDSLVFFENPPPYSNSSGVTTKVTLRLTPEAVSTLDYLALGDSYSSGEGDYAVQEYDRHNNFLPYTDELGPPREMCHVSYHSYPMLLGDYYHLGSSSMRSIACSGALTIDVDKYANQSLGPPDLYLGQQDRLKDFSGMQTYQNLALTDFVPGRIEQIKFVEKYKPKVLTIGIGGNDVGFADRVKDCVRLANYVCPEAQENGDARQRLARLMWNEFYALRDLYAKLRSISPQTKIYIIGYPQFIADSGAWCLLDAGYADIDERHFMNEATHYMNLVIKSAAEAAGVQYIDIEHSLDGGRLCEGVFADYVTGIRSQGWLWAIGDGPLRAYLYHPNASGHQKIASVIEKAIGSGFMEGENNQPDSTIQAPAYTEYFGGPSALPGKTTLPIGASSGKDTYQQGEKIIDTSQMYTYQPDSTAQITRHSEPIALGEFPVDEQGRLHYEITIPADTPPGPHQLVFTGTSPFGEPIEYVQEIFVVGSDPNDVDGDGILDSQDQCLFVDPSGQDADHDGVDDICGGVNALRPGVSEGMTSFVKALTSSSLKTASGHNAGSSDELGDDKRTDQSKVVDKKQSSSSLRRAASREISWIIFGAIGVGVFAISIMIVYIIYRIRKKNL